MTDRLVAIVGPTASGKTALALQVAQKLDGEIICADSRTIYRGMDIGTAKPTTEQQKLVPHHMLDLRSPNESYSAAEFQREAGRAIADILARGKLPIVVGGTGLYVDALLYDYQFPAEANETLRAELEQLSLDELVLRLRDIDPDTEEQVDTNNRRRVIRAIETSGQPRTKKPLRANTLMIGCRQPEGEFEKVIEERNKAWLDGELVEEVQSLIERYSPDVEPLNTVPYREVKLHLAGKLSRSELLALLNVRIRQLAKRQLTWFKRNPDIQWFEKPEVAMKAVSEFLTAKV